MQIIKTIIPTLLVCMNKFLQTFLADIYEKVMIQVLLALRLPADESRGSIRTF